MVSVPSAINASNNATDPETFTVSVAAGAVKVSCAVSIPVFFIFTALFGAKLIYSICL
jgi:hypothetical protein